MSTVTSVERDVNSTEGASPALSQSRPQGLELPTDSRRWMWRELVVSRIVVWGAALAALILIGADNTALHALDPTLLTQPFHSLALDRLVEPGARWDSVWYMLIATKGYSSPPTAAFFPLYPSLIGIVAEAGITPVVAGILVSLASLAGSTVLLYRLARLDLSDRAARIAVSLFLFFPFSLFLSAVYTESLFMLLCLGAILSARTERWWLAGVCGGLAAATRLNGGLILLPLAVIALYGPRTALVTVSPGRWWRPRHRLQWSYLWLALVPVGASALSIYLGIEHGAPFETFRVQKLLWGHEFAGPFGAFWQTIIQLPSDLRHVIAGTPKLGTGNPVAWDTHQLIDLPFVIIGLVVLAVSWRRLPAAYTAYVVGLLLVISTDPTKFEPLQSFPRYLLTAFPLFIGAAAYLEHRPKLTRATLAVSTLGLVAFSAIWGTWAWVG